MFLLAQVIQSHHHLLARVQGEEGLMFQNFKYSKCLGLQYLEAFIQRASFLPFPALLVWNSHKITVSNLPSFSHGLNLSPFHQFSQVDFMFLPTFSSWYVVVGNGSGSRCIIFKNPEKWVWFRSPGRKFPVDSIDYPEKIK